MRITMRANYPRSLFVNVTGPNTHGRVGNGGYDQDLSRRASTKTVTKFIVVTLMARYEVPGGVWRPCETPDGLQVRYGGLEVSGGPARLLRASLHDMGCWSHLIRHLASRVYDSK